MKQPSTPWRWRGCSRWTLHRNTVEKPFRERIADPLPRPADFKAYWAEAKAKLAKTPLDARQGTMQTFGPQEINDYNVASAALPADYDPTGHRCEAAESGKVNFAGAAMARDGRLRRPQARLVG